MSMTLADYRSYVRNYFDLSADELSDTLVDTWVRDGFMRIARRINSWPFYEARTTLLSQSGKREYTIASMRQISRIVGPRGALELIDEGEAESRYLTQSPATGPVEAYSVWAGGVNLWPTPTSAESFSVRGLRNASDWMAGGAAATPDLPTDFHTVLLDFVMAEAHLFQEDQDLAEVRARSFADGVAELVKSETEAPLDAPIVVNGAKSAFFLSEPRLNVTSL